MLSRAPLGSTSGTARPVSRLIRRTSARIGSCGSVTVATRPSVGASGRRPPPSCCPQSATWTSRPGSGRERSVIARWEQGAVAPSLEAPPESLRPRRPRGAVRRRGTARESRHATTLRLRELRSRPAIRPSGEKAGVDRNRSPLLRSIGAEPRRRSRAAFLHDVASSSVRVA